jgi:hypothetical protein
MAVVVVDEIEVTTDDGEQPCLKFALVSLPPLANPKSRSHWQFEQSVAVGLPVILMSICSGRRWPTGSLVGRDASQSLMHWRLIEVFPKL